MSEFNAFLSAVAPECEAAQRLGIGMRQMKPGMDVHSKNGALQVNAYGTFPVPDPAEDAKTLDLRIDGIVKKAASKAADGENLATA